MTTDKLKCVVLPYSFCFCFCQSIDPFNLEKGVEPTVTTPLVLTDSDDKSPNCLVVDADAGDEERVEILLLRNEFKTA